MGPLLVVEDVRSVSRAPLGYKEGRRTNDAKQVGEVGGRKGIL